ncbi:MAG: hypothetical protein ACI8TA_001601, partial [Cyclobacteriaceae bacterium]
GIATYVKRNKAKALINNMEKTNHVSVFILNSI